MKKNVPCADLELERRFVSTKLAGGDLLSGIDLNPDDLCSPRLREIYRAALYLDANLDNWGIDSIIDYLQSEKKLDFIVSRDYLFELSTSTNDIELNVRPMVTRLRTLAIARRKREVLQKALTALDVADYDLADREILSIADSVILGSDSKMYSALDLANETRRAVESMQCGKKLVIPTRLPYLDHHIGGLFPGGMFTIAGYSSTGKSQLTLLISKNVAENGYPAGIISVEDPVLITGSRLVSQVTGEISSKNIFVGETSTERLERIIKIIDKYKSSFEKLPLHVAVCSVANTSDVVDTAIKLIKEKHCKVIALDYIQRVRIDYKSNRYDKAIAEIAKLLKGVCARYDVALIVASQLTRPKESTIYKKPHPNQLKESGDLENESEVIVMLWDESSNANARTLFWIAKGKIGNKGAEGVLIRNTKTGMICDMGEKTDGDSDNNKTIIDNTNDRYR